MIFSNPHSRIFFPVLFGERESETGTTISRLPHSPRPGQGTEPATEE